MPCPALPRPAPISVEEYRARRQTLMADLPLNSAVLLLSASLKTRSRDSEYAFRQDSDFHYLTGFPEPEALLLLLPGREEGESILFCQDKDATLETWSGFRLGAAGAEKEYGLDQAFENVEREVRLSELLDGRETLYLPLDDGESLALADAIRSELGARRRQGAVAPSRFSDVTPLLHEQRLVKSEGELALLRHAAEISSRAHVRAMRTVAPGLYEYQLQAELEHEFAWHGASAPAYASIVGGGVNACVLHYIANRQQLDDGDLVLIDAGAEFALYAGDITRTFPVNGRFSAPQRALYEVVLAAQERAVTSIAPGITLTEIHEGVVHDLTRGLLALGLLEGDGEQDLASHIESATYRRFYMHSTSHWLGLDVHDVGDYQLAGKPRHLIPGMVLTIEPGLYIPDADDIPQAFRGIGIRIEDNVAVTASGHEILTDSVPKRVADIEQLMAK